jgi:hypothetical protein
MSRLVWRRDSRLHERCAGQLRLLPLVGSCSGRDTLVCLDRHRRPSELRTRWLTLAPLAQDRRVGRLGSIRRPGGPNGLIR